MPTNPDFTGYEHDIFVSYRRSDKDWVRWTRENFVRALGALLHLGLGPVNIYVDDAIETGASWPHDLAKHLARSKLLVALLSRDYFGSDWCRLEIDLMYRREQALQFRTPANPFGLIIPITIDDGECFPQEIKAMQCELLHQFANPFMRLDSPRQEAMAERLRERLCPAIESALRRVPRFDPEWERIAHHQFAITFQVNVPVQLTVPTLSLPA